MGVALLNGLGFLVKSINFGLIVRLILAAAANFFISKLIFHQNLITFCSALESWASVFAPNFTAFETGKLRKMFQIFPAIEHPFPYFCHILAFYLTLRMMKPEDPHPTIRETIPRGAIIAVSGAIWMLTAHRIAELHFVFIVVCVLHGLIAAIVDSLILFCPLNFKNKQE